MEHKPKEDIRTQKSCDAFQVEEGVSLSYIGKCLREDFG